MLPLLFVLLHFVILAFSVMIKSKLDFYSIFYSMAKNKVLHILHTSLVVHIALRICFFVTNFALEPLSSSEFSVYLEKCSIAVSEVITLISMLANDISISSLLSLGLLYCFKSYSWTLYVKAQKKCSKKMILSSSIALILSLFSVLTYSGIIIKKVNIFGYLMALEYSLVFLSLLKDISIMIVDYLKVEQTRTIIIFFINFVVLSLKACTFGSFIYFFTQKSKFPYGVFKTLLLVLRKLYKKIEIFKKYLVLMKNLNSIKEVDVDGICAICTDDIEKGKKLKCGHFFHSSCLNMWCEREVTCPICRSELIFENKTYETDEYIYEGVPVAVEE